MRNNILNTNYDIFFYDINKNFTKIVSKVCSIKRIVYKKITPTAKLVKSEIFVYNSIQIKVQRFFKKRKSQLWTKIKQNYAKYTKR